MTIGISQKLIGHGGLTNIQSTLNRIGKRARSEGEKCSRSSGGGKEGRGSRTGRASESTQEKEGDA